MRTMGEHPYIGRCPNGDQFVANREPPVDTGGSALHDFRHVDSVVAGNVLVANAAGDRETKTFGPLDQVDLDDLGPVLLSLHIQLDNVSGLLQRLDGRRVRHIHHCHVIHLWLCDEPNVIITDKVRTKHFFTEVMQSLIRSRPSIDAAPPGISLVM